MGLKGWFANLKEKTFYWENSYIFGLIIKRNIKRKFNDAIIKKSDKSFDI